MTSSPAVSMAAAETGEALRAAIAEPSKPPFTRRQILVCLLGAAALVAYPFLFDNPFPRHVMIMIFLYALMAQSWNIMAGYCGQISLGHAIFFGIGAYSSTFLYITFGLPPWPGMNVGMELLVDTVEDVLSVPMDAVRRDRQVHYVWKSTPGAPVATRVRLGRNNLTHVVIQEGVEVGDRVYLSPPLDVEPPTFDQGTPNDQGTAGAPAEEGR